MLFLPKVSVLLSLNTNSSTVFLLSLVLLCSRRLVVLMLRSWSQIGKSLLPWKLLKLSAGCPLPGLVCSTWSRSLTGLGDLAAITTFSTHRPFRCYPLPNVADFTSRLKGCKLFTKLDLTKGYYQVPMALGDIPKTEVITPFGLFEWVRMPFGLRNAGCTFQHLMDQILGDLPHCFVYVDDILISSPDIKSHLQHVLQVPDRLRLHGLSINPDKCVFTPGNFPPPSQDIPPSIESCLLPTPPSDISGSYQKVTSLFFSQTTNL